jgi:hypothetical protein
VLQNENSFKTRMGAGKFLRELARIDANWDGDMQTKIEPSKNGIHERPIRAETDVNFNHGADDRRQTRINTDGVGGKVFTLIPRIDANFLDKYFFSKKNNLECLSADLK